MKTQIEKFLEGFPKDATSWADATDEIRDLSRWSRELLEENDGVTVEPVDFKAIKTPAEWNTKGRESILANFDRMTPATQEAFYNEHREWFETQAPKSWSETRHEELVEEIKALHRKIKKTDFRDLLVESVRLEKHLAAQSISTLVIMKRFCEELLNTDNE